MSKLVMNEDREVVYRDTPVYQKCLINMIKLMLNYDPCIHDW